jgi:hypothetical protein
VKYSIVKLILFMNCVFRFHLFLLLCLSGGLIKTMTENDSLTLLSNASQSYSSGIFYRLI